MAPTSEFDKSCERPYNVNYKTLIQAGTYYNVCRKWVIIRRYEIKSPTVRLRPIKAVMVGRRILMRNSEIKVKNLNK